MRVSAAKTGGDGGGVGQCDEGAELLMFLWAYVAACNI